MDIEECDKYEVDLKNTIYSNSLQVFITLVGFLVLVFFIQVFQLVMNQFTLPEMKILALFVFGYSVLKCMFAVQPDITIHYKLKVLATEQKE